MSSLYMPRHNLKLYSKIINVWQWSKLFVLTWAYWDTVIGLVNTKVIESVSNFIVASWSVTFTLGISGNLLLRQIDTAIILILSRLLSFVSWPIGGQESSSISEILKWKWICNYECFSVNLLSKFMFKVNVLHYMYSLNHTFIHSFIQSVI